MEKGIWPPNNWSANLKTICRIWLQITDILDIFALQRAKDRLTSLQPYKEQIIDWFQPLVGFMQRWVNQQVLGMAATVFSYSEVLCIVNNKSSLRLIPSATNNVLGRQKANMSLLRLSSGKKSKVGVKLKLKLVVRAAGGDLLGDIGARDPFPAEIESNFGEKVLGAPGTEHKILIPSSRALSLAEKPCNTIPSGQPPMSRQEATALLRKVVGWRIVEEDDGLRLQCLWKVKNFTSGIELMKMIASVAEAAGHHPDLHLEAGNSVRAQIWTHSIGGLSLNDFILAAKMDQINISDLIPRKRAWA